MPVGTTVCVMEQVNAGQQVMPTADDMWDDMCDDRLSQASSSTSDRREGRRSKDWSTGGKTNKRLPSLLDLYFPPGFAKGKAERNIGQNRQISEPSPKYRRLTEENGVSQREGYERYDDRSHRPLRHKDWVEDRKLGDEVENRPRDTGSSQPHYCPSETGSTGVTSQESNDVDVADFLLSNPKYHDCYFTVGNPETDVVERIGATSVYLIANSSVFRKMLEDHKDLESSDSLAHITDVSPEIFKLMLRYIYGGKLKAKTAIEVAALALCADLYKIPRLKQKTSKRLNPVSADYVFPALVCVTYTNYPDLELKVSKIIQQETDRVMQNPDFLHLAENCVIYILKHNTLNISELEVWRNVVRWAEHQVAMFPSRTVRDCMYRVLGHVRLLTFTPGEVLEHVLPTKILTPEEFMDLTLAVIKKKPLESPVLCKIQEKRSLYKRKDRAKVETSVVENNSVKSKFGKASIFRPDYYSDLGEFGNSTISTLSVKVSEAIEIVSFTCWNYTPNTNEKLVCDVTISRTTPDKSITEVVEVIRVEDMEADYSFVLPLKMKSRQSLILNPGEMWTFDLEFQRPHPVYWLYSSDPNGGGSIDKTCTPLRKENATFTYGGPFHVVRVDYKTQ